MKFLLVGTVLGLMSASAAELSVAEGVMGLPRPKVSQADGSNVFTYGNLRVVVTPEKDAPGEEIAVYLGTTPRLVIPNADSANYFAGVSGDTVFVISQTGPDGVLSIYSLSGQRQVFSAGFHPPARIVKGNSVEIDKLTRALKKLNASDRKAFPKVAELVDQGLSAGWFQKVRLDLTTYREEKIGEPVLRPMQ